MTTEVTTTTTNISGLNNDSLSAEDVIVECNITQLKRDLDSWKYILLPLNNLLEWEHKFDPLIIVSSVSFIFGILLTWNPSILTTIGVLGIVALSVDFLVPILVQNLFKGTEWSPIADKKYTRICERICNFYNHLITLRVKVLQLRREKQSLYFLITLFFLIFCIYVGQSVDNLLLTYFTVLVLCLLPGARRNKIPEKVTSLVQSLLKKQQTDLDKKSS